MAKDYEKGMTSTLRELKNIVEKGVTEKEIAIFKEINRNQYILAHESNLTRLKLYHALIVQGYNEALYREYQEKVASLTRKQINSALKENIDLNRLVISASGPITHHGKPIIPAKT
jgi:predicted Zn-dependent peptidase